MPRRYNYLATITPNDYAIGICPVCNIRLTHGCEHSQSDDYQEWLAAQVVCEVYGELSDTEARALHDALVLCATDPLHIINTSLDWQATEVQVNAAYGEVDLSPVQRGEKIPRKPRTKKGIVGKMIVCKSFANFHSDNAQDYMDYFGAQEVEINR